MCSPTFWSGIHSSSVPDEGMINFSRFEEHYSFFHRKKNCVLSLSQAYKVILSPMQYAKALNTRWDSVLKGSLSVVFIA